MNDTDGQHTWDSWDACDVTISSLVIYSSSHSASKFLQFCADGNLHFSCKCHSRRLLGQHRRSSQASKCIPLDLGSRRKKKNLRELDGWISLNMIWFLQACSSSSTGPFLKLQETSLEFVWFECVTILWLFFAQKSTKVLKTYLQDCEAHEACSVFSNPNMLMLCNL